ncbi:MAG: aspartate/glutamate racemase family protein [Amphritea sp.]
MNAAFNSSRHKLGRVGMIVPLSNTNLEPDCGLLTPADVSVHFTRLGGYDIDVTPGIEEMRALALASVDDILHLLTAAKVNVIGYGCASATLSCGLDFDRRLREDMQAKAGVPVVTVAGAMVEALALLDATRIAFTSPYVRDLNRESASFFEEAGIQVVNFADHAKALSSVEQGLMTPQDVFELGCAADHPEADAIAIGCTDFRAVEAIEALERKLGKPVVTSNQALMFACLARIGVDPTSVENGGRLFKINAR